MKYVKFLVFEDGLSCTVGGGLTTQEEYIVAIRDSLPPKYHLMPFEIVEKGGNGYGDLLASVHGVYFGGKDSVRRSQ